MPRLKVRGGQQDDLGVGVIRRGPVVFMPQTVSGASTRRADVGVTVVTIDAPSLQHPLDVALVPGPTDVIDDTVLGPSLQRSPNLRSNLVERLVPVDPLPAAFATLADSLHRVQNPLGIVNLIDCSRALGAGPATASGVVRVPLKLGDLP